MTKSGQSLLVEVVSGTDLLARQSSRPVCLVLNTAVVGMRLATPASTRKHRETTVIWDLMVASPIIEDA